MRDPGDILRAGCSAKLEDPLFDAVRVIRERKLMGMRRDREIVCVGWDVYAVRVRWEFHGVPMRWERHAVRVIHAMHMRKLTGRNRVPVGNAIFCNYR